MRVTKPKRTRRPRFTCIYKIECLATGYVYIGSSKDVSSRWNAHIYNLIHFKHSSKAMIVDWHKYGPQSFHFSIVRLLDSSEGIRSIEQSIMDSYKNLYNRVRAVRKRVT